MEKILVVDDESIIRENLERIFIEERYAVDSVATGREALAVLEGDDADVLLLDLNLPDTNGLEVLQRAKELDPELMVIIITGYASVDSAVKALKLGAYDYIKKPFKADVIKLIVRLAFEAQRLKKKVGNLERQIRKIPSQPHIIAESDQMRHILTQVTEVARHDGATVLITGESGTGKQVVAQSVHQLSPRQKKPFLEINCAALPDNLLESELFGYEKGAFTDARQRKKGLFETAEGGTVFLDEIGEMPLNLQAKLLGVLENKRFRRLGGYKDVESDVRIVAATNIDPKKAIEEKRFREDLYYRLNVFPIHIPPLRERPDDVLALAHLFLLKYARQFGKSFKEITSPAGKYLRQYAWPGNVRELRNVLERICIMHNEPALRVSHLPPEIVSFENSDAFIEIPEDVLDIEAVVDEVTCQLIHRAMKKADGNTASAARLLGIPRGTLRYKLKKYKIDAR
ncbi:sigma-54-dependent Fis family transcriptional re gulator [Desulfonema ishimotonii]|uniref:Sigma-54-dependent Fis family transcriptional re gulator n=1 Tax=Desulfonema ishimotonii TaxID=45657 RepID=A0A401G013_9BACT|nr:sigma-54 dependent transcriptional regulator [Desulfonema ishimotonii]GBC62537.1 sigma-54-dependent Fis family transcriptional re gulator [Desulfonema ishimotonii]